MDGLLWEYAGKVGYELREERRKIEEMDNRDD